MVRDVAVVGSLVLVATQSGRVDVFDWREGRARPPLLEVSPAQGQALAPTIRSVAVSPERRRAAVAASDGRLRLYALDEGGNATPLASVEAGDVTVCRFLDEERLLLGTLSGELVGLRTGADATQIEETFRRQLEYDPVHAIEPGPKGDVVAVAFRSSRVQLVRPVSGETFRVLRGHRDAVYALAWLGADRLASAGKDKRVLVWELVGPEVEPRVLHRADRYVTALAFDPDAKRMAIAVEGETIGLMNVADGHVEQRLGTHTAPVQALVFLDQGRRLLSAGNDARILVWDLSEDAGQSP
jgi:WD40 repeat protein